MILCLQNDNLNNYNVFYMKIMIIFFNVNMHTKTNHSNIKYNIFVGTFSELKPCPRCLETLNVPLNV